VDGADSPKPMNAAATITEGKGTTGGFARVVGLYEEAAATAERNDPDRERGHREDAMLAAVSWPPPHFPRETRVALLADVTEAKARRDVQSDPERAAAQAKRNCDNAYSNGLRSWMAAATTCEHTSCLPGACGYR
jgi:hypothetical protein